MKKLKLKEFEARNNFYLPSLKEQRKHQRIFVHGLITAYRMIE